MTKTDTTGLSPDEHNRAQGDARILTESRDFILDAALRVLLAGSIDLRGIDPIEAAAMLVYDFDDLVQATREGHGLRANVGGSDTGDPA